MLQTLVLTLTVISDLSTQKLAGYPKVINLYQVLIRLGYAPDISVKNALIDHTTLTFDL